MTTTTIAIGTMSIKQWGPGNNFTQTSTPVKLFRRTTVKQDNVRRVKPSVLSLNYGTALSHSDHSVSEAYTNIVLSNPIRVIQAPVGEYVTAGPPVYNWQSMVNTIGGKLRAQIKDENLNLAQSVAEYRQTCNMFAGAARDIVSAFRSLRSGRGFSDFVRMLQSPRNRYERTVANRWLEYQYGLKPLIQDIYGATDQLADDLRTGIVRRARTSQSVNTQVTDSSGTPPLRVQRQWDIQHTARGVAEYVISDSSIKSLAQMGISNPLLLGWELIPYSFVVDQMFPIGNFLASLDALNGTSSFVWVYSETRNYTGRFSIGSSSSTSSGREFIRNAPSANVPMPRLSYQPSTSLTAVLNGLALLSQIRTGR